MSSYAEEEQDAREYAELKMQFAEEREEEARLARHDGDAIEHDGKTFHFERLDNGLLRTYDYQCQWALTYEKVDGEWQPSNVVAMGTPYRGIVAKLNATIQPTFSVGDGEPMI